MLLRNGKVYEVEFCSSCNKVAYKLWYGDYGGVTPVCYDCYLKAYEAKKTPEPEVEKPFPNWCGCCQ